MKEICKLIMHEESGQGMVEYSLIIVLVAIAAIGGLIALKGGVESMYNSIPSKLS